MFDINRYKPKFWDHHDLSAGPYKPLFNFRLIWKQSVFLTLSVALIPLLFLAAMDYRVTQKAEESEILLRTSRLLSNTRRSLSYFLDERRFALSFIVLDNIYDDLADPVRLGQILKNLQSGLGQWSDLSLIDDKGVQQNYIGPYTMKNINYSDQDWYRDAVLNGSTISDVFMGFRNVPHLVIAVKHQRMDETPYVLRAALDIERLRELLSQLALSGQGDVFIINHKGILQTPSRYYGHVLEKMPFPIPDFSTQTQVLERTDPQNRQVIMGYAYITGTPFILMVVKHKHELMQPWYNTRFKLLLFLSGSILIILIVVIGVSTYLVNNIFVADQKRVTTLHQAEYTNKLASIGRLAAGVAHEINNPLAIINEKAGMINDIFLFRKEYQSDTKLIGLVKAIIQSVDRCAAITRRLLNFARHIEVSVQKVNLKGIIQDVLGFQTKEAEYRSIDITVDIPDDIPEFTSDRGKLQQIFLNLVNNAFSAMRDGGNLVITARLLADAHQVRISVKDDGCGIPETDLKRIFEPFFTTKTSIGGTGLGLSITYGLVRELGGDIEVVSTEGTGTTFTVTLPLEFNGKKGESHACSTGG
jgi:signal transduction histidine kinase